MLSTAQVFGTCSKLVRLTALLSTLLVFCMRLLGSCRCGVVALLLLVAGLPAGVDQVQALSHGGPAAVQHQGGHDCHPAAGPACPHLTAQPQQQCLVEHTSTAAAQPAQGLAGLCAQLRPTHSHTQDHSSAAAQPSTSRQQRGRLAVGCTGRPGCSQPAALCLTAQQHRVRPQPSNWRHSGRCCLHISPCGFHVLGFALCSCIYCASGWRLLAADLDSWCTSWRSTGNTLKQF